MPGADRERKRPAVEAEAAEDGDLVADVCDTPVEPGLLIGEHVPHEGCTLRLPSCVGSFGTISTASSARTSTSGSASKEFSPACRRSEWRAAPAHHPALAL
jgi:hypothetical protein